MRPMSTRRHEARRPTGRRPGNSGTREAILAAAAQHFAERGYDRASLRAIAGAAGVDHKLIAHFFGSKQQLFVAALGLPLDPAEVLPSILAGDRAGLEGRLAGVLVAMLEQPELHLRMTSVIRAAASEPAVARMLREFLGRELLARAPDLLDSADGAFRVNLVGSQLVGLFVARYIVRVEPLASMPAADVVTAVVPTLRRYLVGRLETTDEQQPSQTVHRPARHAPVPKARRPYRERPD
jgi:AcrR family transcriptional regulator